MGVNDTRLPPGGSHGFVGDYAGDTRLDPISERQTVREGTRAAAGVDTTGPVETIDETSFKDGPTPEDMDELGKGFGEKEAVLHPRGRILMTAGNPNGWKLEDLCDQLTREMLEKSHRITDSGMQTDNVGEAARIALANNGQVIGLFQRIRQLQIETMAAFAKIGPDQGPTGTPRTEKTDGEA